MSKYVIGIDIGGTKIAGGLVDAVNGKVIRKIKVFTGKKISEGIRSLVFVIDKIRGNKIYPIGIGCAGQIDIKSGKVVYSPNMPAWRNVPVVKILKSKLRRGQEIEIDNDANCFTLAEWKFGAGKGFKNVIGLTLGTGTGSGAVLDGKLYHGQGYAPELGHMTVQIGGKKCKCGKFGHLEAYVSGKAIEKEYFQATGKKLSATDIEELAQSDGKRAKPILQTAKEYLACGLANVISSFDPDVIILGGSIGVKLNLLYLGLEKLVVKNLFFKNRKIKIKKAKLGQGGGLIGAAMLFSSID